MILLVDVYAITVLGFFALIAIALYRDRKHVEVKAYIFFLRKTKKGIEILDQVARPKTLWKIVGTVGILVAFYLMFYGMFLFSEIGKGILSGQIKQPGLNLIFPSPSSQQVAGSGYILIPFWSWIILIASVIVPHEFMHGVLSRVEKVRVKSVGLALFAIFPGAFVEPDERQLKKIGLLGKLRIFAAGGFSNFIVYLLVFALVTNVVWPAFVPGSVVLTDVNDTGPAAVAGMAKGDVITKIEQTPLTISYADFFANQRYLSKYFEELKPGDTITLQSATQSFTVKTVANPTNVSKAYLGITYEPVVTGDKQIFYDTVNLLTWMWILNLTIALVNLAPIYPLDGGLMVKALADKTGKKYAMKLTVAITLITVAILAIDLVAPFFI